MNLFIISIKNLHEEVTGYTVFQSKKTMSEIYGMDFWEIAEIMGLDVDADAGDSVEIDSVGEPPILY